MQLVKFLNSDFNIHLLHRMKFIKIHLYSWLLSRKSDLSKLSQSRRLKNDQRKYADTIKTKKKHTCA